MAENVNITIRAFDKTKKGFGTVTSGLKKVTGAVFSMRTALVGVAGVAGFGLLVKRSLHATDSLAKTASKIGTTTEALGGLRYAAELTGVATNTMDMALQRFTRRTAEAAMGTGEAKGAIKELGINAKELNQMPLDKRMVVLADAFSKVTSKSDRLRLAFKLFDSEGAALVNTLSGGSDALKEMLGEAEMLGLTMSSSAAKGVEDTVDALTKLKSMAKGVTDQFVAALAPAIQSLTESITIFFAKIAKNEGGVEEWARGLAKGFLESVANIIRALDTGLTAIGGFVNKANGFLNKFDVKSQENKLKSLTEEIGILGKEVLDLQGGGNISLTDRLFGKDLGSKKLELEDLMFKAILARQKLQEMNAPIVGDGLSGFFDKTLAKILELKETIGGSNGKGNIFAPAEEGANNAQKAFAAWQATVKDGDEIVQAFTTNGLNGMTDALTAGVTGAANFADAMKSMAKSVIDSLIKMLIQKYIVDAAFGFITNKIGGSLTTGSSNMQGNLDATNAALSFNGGGFTGMGSRSGGVDGKGGFPAILHPNETVVDHTKGQSSGGVVVNQTINVTTGIQSTVRAEIINLLPAISKASQNGVADARLRGGNFSRAMGGA
tara:strand:+ start:83 stop:1906 length:1824 start_codon:yes stop_codon:yes gene_type:complete